MSWRDDLPRIRAENEAERVARAPALKAHQEKVLRRREIAASAIARGLKAINATDEERAAVRDVTGFGA